MEYRIADYTINGQNITLPKVTDIEDIRLIFNETQKVLICSTASKGNITTIITDPVAGTSTVVVPTSVCTINPNDKLTIKCDYGDDLSSVAKQGDNQDATNSKILEEVQNKLTPLEAVLTELNHGKQEIANSINFKGTETNAEKSLSELALDIRKIQNVSKEFQTIDYMEDVVGMRSAMEFINEVATNDYVAYACYVLGTGSKFNVATNPNAMYLSDGTLIISPNGEYEIPAYEGNSYGAVVLAYNGRSILTENLSTDILQIAFYNAIVHIPVLPSNTGFFFSKSCELTFEEKALASLIYFYNEDIELLQQGLFTSSTSIQYVSMPNVKSINTDNNNGLFYNSSIKHIHMPNLTNIGTVNPSYAIFMNCKNITTINLPSVIRVQNRFCQDTTGLKYVNMPSLISLPRNGFRNCTSLIECLLPSVVTYNTNTNESFLNCPNLINIMIGCFNENLSLLSGWYPSNVISSGKVESLDANIRNNIAMRIADRAEKTALTITFHQNVRNILSEETEAVFAAKNWNISPAKSV